MHCEIAARFGGSQRMSDWERLLRPILLVVVWNFAVGYGHAQAPDRVRASVPALLAKIDGADSDSRANTAHALARIGSPAVEPLIDHVKNLNHPMSGFDLRNRLKPAVLPFLVQRLNDPDAGVRAELLRAIAEVAHSFASPADIYPDDEEPPSPTPEEVKERAHARELKTRAAQAIVPLLKDPDSSVRWNAAALLGKLGVQSKLVVPALMEMLRTEKVTVTPGDRTIELKPLPSRYFGIGMYSLPHPWPPVDEVRLAAIDGLGQFGADAVDAVPQLAAILGGDTDLPALVRGERDPQHWPRSRTRCTGLDRAPQVSRNRKIFAEPGPRSRRR